MSLQTVGFIGAGRAAKILLGGWKRAGRMPSRVVLYDCEKKTCDGLKSLGPEVEAADGVENAAAQDMVFLAVHPPVVKSAVETVRTYVRSDAIVVSLAPKFTIDKLSEMLGGFKRIARMIPNAPAIVGRGYNPMAFGEALGEQDQAALYNLFAGLGDCVEVPEAQLEVYAVVTAMGLTFLWPQLDMLASLGENGGLSREAAWNGIEKMLSGAVAAMCDSGLTSAEVQDLVPVKPAAEETAAFVNAAKPKLEGLLAKLRP